MTSAFVGRASELAELGVLLGRSHHSGFAAALVVGDPGVGKSRLLDETIARAAEGLRVTRVVGHEIEQEIPLSAVAPFLRLLMEEGRTGSDLAAALHGASMERAPSSRLRIFELAHRARRALGPLVIVVDDLQWADSASVSLLAYLMQESPDDRRRLAVLTAARASPRAAQSWGLISRLVPEGSTVEIELRGLDLGDMLAMGRDLAPRMTEEELELTARRAEGSPYWLQALVRSGRPDTEPALLLQRQLHELPPDAVSLLALLAVAARPLPREAVESILHWSADRTAGALGAANVAGLLIEDVAVRPAHDLVRETVVGRLEPGRRRALHLKLAEWLEEKGTADIARLMESLQHRVAAQRPSLELGLRIARSAQRRLLSDEGVAMLVRLADDAADMEIGVSLRLELASLAAELGNDVDALRWSLLLAAGASDPQTRVLALLAASRAALELGDREQALELLERAEAHGDVDRWTALALKTQRVDVALHLRRGDLDAHTLARAREVADGARLLADEAGGTAQLARRDQSAYARAIQAEWVAAWVHPDEDERQRAAASISSDLAHAQGIDEEIYLSARLAHALATDSIATIRDVRDSALRRVFPKLALTAGVMLVQRLLTFGRLLEAEDEAAVVSDLAGRVNDVAFGRARLSLFECIIGLYRGPWLEALEALEHEASTLEDPRHRYQALVERAHWLARVAGPSRADDVRADLAAARVALAAGEFHVFSDWSVIAEAEALARIGDAAAAEALLPTLGMRHEPEHPWEPLRLHVIEALLKLHRRDARGASHELEQVLTTTRSAGLALEALWIQLDLGRALVSVERTRAAAVFRTAARDAHELGATTLVELAEKELRSLGVRTWQRGARNAGDGLASLTERELEIVALLAAGASNPEIAARLFVSRKTVERHVSNALGKAGARNRAELAAQYGAAPPGP